MWVLLAALIPLLRASTICTSLGDALSQFYESRLVADGKTRWINSDEAFETMRGSKLRIGNLIAVTGFSALYEADFKSREDAIVKFSKVCESEGDPDSVTREFGILSVLQPLGITPAVMWLSGKGASSRVAKVRMTLFNDTPQFNQDLITGLPMILDIIGFCFYL